MKIWNVAALLTFSVHCFGQKHNKPIKPFSELYITPHVGLSWQSTPFKPVFDLSHVSEFDVSHFPYNYEKNTQGFGFDLGFTLTTNIGKQVQAGIKTNGRFRYDYLYGGIEDSKQYSEVVKGFLFDYSASLILIYNSKKNRIGLLNWGLQRIKLAKMNISM